MEKHAKSCSVRKEAIDSHLGRIIQLWRVQREILYQNLKSSIYSKQTQNFKSTQHHLEPLCECLMDYISAGHFEVYEKLLESSKSLIQDRKELVNNIYHNIESSTDQALSFNDKYVNSEEATPSHDLSNDLLKLNKSLAIRFVLEEQLVEILRV